MGQRGNHKGNYKIAETNDKGNKTTQNLWDIAKTMLRAKFIAIQAFLSNKKVSGKQPNQKQSNLKELEKEEPKKPKVSRR